MKILVYGWYHQGNLGDELFKEAFTHLFPSFHFTFTNQITVRDLKEADGVFIGGGSFLGDDLSREAEALEILQQKKILYLGVGGETDIHPIHQDLMRRAHLIATRSPDYVGRLKELNDNVIVVPDLVYALPCDKAVSKKRRTVLIVPNIMVVPTWSEPNWKHTAWAYFKSEFSQFLDTLNDHKFTIDFMPFCVNDMLDDRAAAIEIMNATQYRKSKSILHPRPLTFRGVTQLMSQYDVIITQRFHGVVLSDIIGARYISISHHDKLKNSAGYNLPYYGLTKQQLLNAVATVKVSSLLPIDSNIFVDLKRRVDDALCRD